MMISTGVSFFSHNIATVSSIHDAIHRVHLVHRPAHLGPAVHANGIASLNEQSSLKWLRAQGFARMRCLPREESPLQRRTALRAMLSPQPGLQLCTSASEAETRRSRTPRCPAAQQVIFQWRKHYNVISAIQGYASS